MHVKPIEVTCGFNLRVMKKSARWLCHTEKSKTNIKKLISPLLMCPRGVKISGRTPLTIFWGLLTNQCKQRISPKEFLSKNPPKKFSPKKSSPKKSSQKFSPKKFPKKSQKIFEKNPYILKISNSLHLWQYGMWSFQTGGTKLERFLRKNQIKGNYSILRIGLVGTSKVFNNQSFKSQLILSSQKKTWIDIMA